MKKVLWCLALASIIGLSVKMATADEGRKAMLRVQRQSEETIIKDVYTCIDFKNEEAVSFEAFKYAYKGYLNLLTAGKLGIQNNVLTIIDFSLSSRERRMWILDMRENKLLFRDYVAHGQGSGDEFARIFSNKENSHQSSLGFYVTGTTYTGDHGTSLYLHGLDAGFNSAAYQRAIVVHGADYVSPSFITAENRLGRSWGCPAVSNQHINEVINLIKEGSCMFLFYPQRNYLARSKWINRSLPADKSDRFGMESNYASAAVYDSAGQLTPLIPGLQAVPFIIPQSMPVVQP